MYDHELDRKLSLVANGANAHTVYKCRFYYSHPATSDKIKEELRILAYEAMATNDWKPLKERMKNWW